MNNCEATIRPALSSILDSFQIESDERSCRVVTPFRHHNDDLLRFWIRPLEDGFFEIRDFGETQMMLEMYGVDPSTDSRKPRLKKIKQQFDLDAALEGEFKIMSAEARLGERILDMIQAMQAASYFVYTHQARQPSRFRTKVGTYFEDKGYDYDSDFSVQGTSQERTFDFSINHRQPTVLIDTIHSNQEYALKHQADSVLVNWYQLEDKPYSHGAIIDDENGIEDEEILSGLRENLDYYFRWSEKSLISKKIPVKRIG